MSDNVLKISDFRKHVEKTDEPETRHDIRDGVELIKYFMHIGEASDRAAVISLARKLAQRPNDASSGVNSKDGKTEG